MNMSLKSEDSRSVQRIIFEKANFGAVPTFFRIEGDPRLHPIQWTKHPHLVEILFSDGSTSHVTATYDPDLERQVGGYKPEIQTASQPGEYNEKEDSPFALDVESNLDELRDMVAEEVAEEQREFTLAVPFEPVIPKRVLTKPLSAEELASWMNPVNDGAEIAPILEQNLEERN